MKKVIIELEVEDNFFLGDYENCPISEEKDLFTNDLVHIDCHYDCEDNCPLRIKEEGQ